MIITLLQWPIPSSDSVFLLGYTKSWQGKSQKKGKACRWDNSGLQPICSPWIQSNAHAQKMKGKNSQSRQGITMVPRRPCLSFEDLPSRILLGVKIHGNPRGSVEECTRPYCWPHCVILLDKTPSVSKMSRGPSPPAKPVVSCQDGRICIPWPWYKRLMF
jgi:hypothetical protein